MSNREYYGNDLPERISQENGTQQPYSVKAAGPYLNEGQSVGTAPNNQQAPLDQQSQWVDFSQSEAMNGTSEQEKGLGATVVGGAGGAFFGHQVGKKSDHGTLGALGGALAGAVMANMASNAVKGIILDMDPAVAGVVRDWSEDLTDLVNHWSRAKTNLVHFAVVMSVV